MNPNIDKFPMANTGPTGANVQGAEFPTPNQVMEQMPSREATSFAPAQPAMPQAPFMQPDAAAAPASNPAPTPQAPSAPSVPHAASPEEDLERKWIAVAKTIVERTKADPYLQSQQLSKAGKEFRAQTGRGVNSDKE